MNEPPCAEFKVWVGLEIEGSTGLGSPTVFVRSMDGYPESLVINPVELSDYLDEHAQRFYHDHVIHLRKGLVPRIWFCKEFRDWGFIESCVESYETVCIEFTAEEYIRGAEPPTAYLRERTRPYIKLGKPSSYFVRRGSHFFFGERFSEESCMLKGKEDVAPKNYEADIPVSLELLRG